MWFRKQDKPRFFGGLLGSVTRALSPYAGTALGGYLGSLSANPAAIAAGGAAGNYIGREGGNRMADVIEQYMPFARGGRVPQRMMGGMNVIPPQSVSNISQQMKSDMNRYLS